MKQKLKNLFTKIDGKAAKKFGSDGWHWWRLWVTLFVMLHGLAGLTSCTTPKTLNATKSITKTAKTVLLTDIAVKHKGFEFTYATDSAGGFKDPHGLLNVYLKPIDSLTQKVTIKFNWLEGWLPKLDSLAKRHVGAPYTSEVIKYSLRIAMLELEAKYPKLEFAIGGTATGKDSFTDKKKLITFKREVVGEFQAKARISFHWLMGIDQELNRLLDHAFEKLEGVLLESSNNKEGR